MGPAMITDDQLEAYVKEAKVYALASSPIGRISGFVAELAAEVRRLRNDMPAQKLVSRTVYVLRTVTRGRIKAVRTIDVSDDLQVIEHNADAERSENGRDVDVYIDEYNYVRTHG